MSKSMNAGQFNLFEQGPPLPQGCKYQRDLIQAHEERELVARLADPPFRAFEFQGYLGKRRVASFRLAVRFQHQGAPESRGHSSFAAPAAREGGRFPASPPPSSSMSS